MDAAVDGGAFLTVYGVPTTIGFRFDGSAESDGRFVVLGGRGGDRITGGMGDDQLFGLGGADVLAGGGGADIFVVQSAEESSGLGHDVLIGFDAASDRIDLPVAVTGFDAAVSQGSLSAGSFDADLQAALANLGTSRAALFTPDAGDLAGHAFLIVDGNGVAGYQAGEDFVFDLIQPAPAPLDNPGIFT